MQASDYILIKGDEGRPVGIYLDDGRFMAQPLGGSASAIDADSARNLIRSEFNTISTELQALLSQAVPSHILLEKFDNIARMGRLLTGTAPVKTQEPRPVMAQSKPQAPVVQHVPASNIPLTLEGTKLKVISAKSPKANKRKAAAAS